MYVNTYFTTSTTLQLLSDRVLPEGALAPYRRGRCHIASLYHTLVVLNAHMIVISARALQIAVHCHDGYGHTHSIPESTRADVDYLTV